MQSGAIIGALFFISIFIFAGVAILVGAVRDRRKLKAASVYDGVIIDYEKRRVRRSGRNGSYTAYFPTISYMCCETEQTFQSKVFYNHITHPVGSHIKVYVGADGMIIYKKEIRLNLFFGIVFSVFGTITFICTLWTVLREFI